MFRGRIESRTDHFAPIGPSTSADIPITARPPPASALEGVPGCAAGRHAARVGASLLSAAGQPQWIAETPQDYVEIALSCRRAAAPCRRQRCLIRVPTDADVMFQSWKTRIARPETLSRGERRLALPRCHVWVTLIPTAAYGACRSDDPRNVAALYGCCRYRDGGTPR